MHTPPAEEPIGRVASLHRYPVKSVGGEDMEAVDLTAGGVLGDRAFAFRDSATGYVVSAKRPKKWPGILGWKASFTAATEHEGELPPVEVTLADGLSLKSSEKSRLEAEVSRALDAPVTLERARPEGSTFEYHWPDIEGLVYQGRTYRDEVTSHDTPSGTFFDSSTINLLTTASLEKMRMLAAPSLFELERFRPNLVVEPMGSEPGFIENSWVGGVLAIGETARIRVTSPCLRCVMVNLGRGPMPADPRILKAVFAHNDGNLGVKGDIAAAGPISVGDLVFRVPA